VKMVHNGIEYGDMQLITEAYAILKHSLGLEAAELAAVFRKWNEGELQSYLIEITADIFGWKDEETGQPLVELIVDRAEQKGTGKWASQVALDPGIPIPTITAAVNARILSALKSERVAAARRIHGPPAARREFRLPGGHEEGIEAVREALYASKICSYAQGFALMAAASREYGWGLDLGQISRIWRGGCIIRAQFLEKIREAFAREPGLASLMLDPYFREALEARQANWRWVAVLAKQAGISTPALSSSLDYFDGYRTERLPANLIQAQRDYFGAHTYQRIDKEGVFHTEWEKDKA
jgi:6-phosphogluconate dehydrogenase